MKYQTLHIIASGINVLAWVVAVVGVLSSIFLGIAASALIPKIYILLGGLVITAIYVLILLATSRFIYLFIDMEEDLSEIVRLLKKESKD